jgi:two-component system, LuxR family, response regulator FixJ
MKVDPHPGPANTQVGNWDWMERATNRLRRSLRPRWRQSCGSNTALRLPALSLLEEDCCSKKI